MMWVLHICHSYYPPFLDCARQYCSLFSDTPYKVLTVYLTGDEDASVKQQTQSDEVVFLGYQSKQVRGLKLNAIAKVRAISQQKEFAFCIAHRAKPTYVALLATQLPVISVHHNYNDYRRFSRRVLVNAFKKRLFMLGVSNDVRDDLRRDLSHWPQSKIQTLYNHIDVDAVDELLFSKGKARKALGIADDAYVIANVGRLHHDKDQATLIRGFAKALPSLPTNTILLIAGEGPLEQELKDLTNQLGLDASVIFAGNVLDAKRYFKAFDLFVLTSDREPFGMVLLEAMVADVPIVCSDCGGGAEVAGEMGCLFSFGDADDLSQHLIDQCGKHDTRSVRLYLEAHFSDEAVKDSFWQLSFIQKIANQSA